MKNLLRKANHAVYTAKNKIDSAVITGTTALGMTLSSFGLCGNANTALIEILKNVGKLVCVLGVVLAIFGLVHYASANSEGDGPAKHKAIMQIASGGMVLVLGAVLTATGLASIVNLITE